VLLIKINLIRNYKLKSRYYDFNLCRYYDFSICNNEIRNYELKLFF